MIEVIQHYLFSLNNYGFKSVIMRQRRNHRNEMGGVYQKFMSKCMVMAVRIRTPGTEGNGVDRQLVTCPNSIKI